MKDFSSVYSAINKKLSTRRLLSSSYNPNQKRILVYQMGRVGSRSIYSSLASSGIPCCHTHALYDYYNYFENILNYSEALIPERIKTCAYWIRLHEMLWNGSLHRPIVLTPFRNPFDVLISGILQNFSRYILPTVCDSLKECNIINYYSNKDILSNEKNPRIEVELLDNYFDQCLSQASLLINSLLKGTANNCPHDDTLSCNGKYIPFQWFEKRFTNDLRCTINDFKHNKDLNIFTIRHKMYDAFVFDINDIDLLWPYISPLISSKPLSLMKSNSNRNNFFSTLYSQIIPTINIPSNIRDEIFSNKWYNFFYDSASIDAHLSVFK